jgi:hypothetical protein
MGDVLTLEKKQPFEKLKRMARAGHDKAKRQGMRKRASGDGATMRRPKREKKGV